MVSSAEQESIEMIEAIKMNPNPIRFAFRCWAIEHGVNVSALDRKLENLSQFTEHVFAARNAED